MGKFHDTRGAEAEGSNRIGETWHAIDMRRNTLAGLIFVDDNLVGQIRKKAVGM